MKLIYKNKNLILIDDKKNSYDKVTNSSQLDLKINQLKNIQKSYKKRLTLKGLGYKCNIEKNLLTFKLNFSHIVQVNIPSYITKSLVAKNVITFESYDKVLLGSFCEHIFRLRPVNIYQQKGFIVPGKPLRTKEVNKKNKKN